MTLAILFPKSSFVTPIPIAAFKGTIFSVLPTIHSWREALGGRPVLDLFISTIATLEQLLDSLQLTISTLLILAIIVY
ncbi:MAG: hypothetical protein PHR98_03415 [Candidatus Shapirobacteria bacterium]|nr:hypothetical protein [Candidatus Shapirobacteria bacterium]